MENKHVSLDVSQGDWNQWACAFYRLNGVYGSLQDLANFEDVPHWIDELMITLEYLLISFITTQDFPGIDHCDIDPDNYIGEIMYDTYLEVSKQQTKSPLQINDGVLQESFAPKLYENIQKALKTLIREMMEEQAINDE